MDQALHGSLTLMTNEVGKVAITDDSKQTALWCLGQLPKLYTQYCKTNESRYGEEITRLVQAVLKELVASRPVCPPAHQLAAEIPERLRLLHEEAGLPRLTLKVPSSPSRKVG